MILDPSSGISSATMADLSMPTLACNESMAKIHVSSLDQLKVQAPEAYNLMLRSIAMHMMHTQQAASARLVRIMKEGQKMSF